MKRCSLSLVLLLSVLAKQPALADPTAGLNQVGSATLKVLLWTIYDSKLYNTAGAYNGIEPGLTLELTYKRKIRAKDLIERTREEWKNLRLYTPESEAFLSQLADLWPDVRRGDSLVLKVNDSLASEFYFNGEPIGKIAIETFTRSFLSIWLSEEGRFPRLRNQLIGQSS